jgi:phosphate/sulfate permease
LHGIRTRLLKWFGETIVNPILDCPYCMPSVHGLGIVLLWHYKKGLLSWQLWSDILMVWAFAAVSAVALNYVLLSVIRYLLAKAAFFEKLNEEDENEMD